MSWRGFRQQGDRGVNDAMIVGIVRTHRATFTTRNIKHFASTGIELVDPWDAPQTRSG